MRSTGPFQLQAVDSGSSLAAGVFKFNPFSVTDVFGIGTTTLHPFIFGINNAEVARFDITGTFIAKTVSTQLRLIGQTGTGAGLAPMYFLGSSFKLATPEVGAVEYDGKSLWLTFDALCRNSVMTCGFTAYGTPVEIKNTTTETSLISSTLVGSQTIKAGFPEVGKTMTMKACGYYSTTGTPTLNLKFKFASSTVCQTTAMTMPSGASNNHWELDLEMTFQSIGVSALVYAVGKFLSIDPSTGTVIGQTIRTTLHFGNTTADIFTDLTATWGTASLSNTITCTNASETWKN